ncbi:helix-turn-helix domain-containing protein [Ferrovum sp. PN-J185]|uniref:helix-turn-helix domain-containing protein n=1 Tax=Ferrovum sp. PN-J185 TaxID=1356306 RepID=UPI00079B3E8E|nr:helix-turn-helix transcriptional regulator [Ferrovum sp. PN-J185]KXW55273.1 antitoxin HipB [Ferrovum sp. PN-J185]MCC6068467.1 helix-turn-helix domain-containing protein [Ferrovum sp. PN-J185]
MDFYFSTESEIRVELGQRLAKLRIAKSLTQSELALKAGVGIATLQRFEQGEGATLSTFIRLMTALGAIQELDILAQTKDVTINALEQYHALKDRKRVAKKKS